MYAPRLMRILLSEVCESKMVKIGMLILFNVGLQHGVRTPNPEDNFIVKLLIRWL